MVETVLVTGGTGFVGGWIIIELLKRGYQVRTSVRSLDKEPALRQVIGGQVEAGDRLAFFKADLLQNAGWDAAMAGCDYVLHVAAPVGVDAPRDRDDLIIPTRDGALRVLRAACAAKVKRVVLTSAIEACRPLMTSPDGVSDESRWTDTKDARLGPYRLAKTLAERAVWDFMSRQTGPTSLTTILPSAILGPVLSADQAGSLRLVQRMLSGGMPGFPNLGFCVVDVRDVADLHIRAMTAPDAAGERFIAAGDWMWMGDLAGVLRSAFGTRAAKVPTRAMPDIMLPVIALFNGEMRFILPLLGRKHVFSAARAQAALGWKPRSSVTTIVDSAQSAIDLGVV